MLSIITQASRNALEILRSPGLFHWYLVPILAFVVYAYVVEIERKRYNLVVTAIAFFGGEFAWEMFNALILHWSNRSAMWTSSTRTSYLILVGLNIEIAMMFAVAGLIFLKALPEDRKKRIWGIPNRLFCILAFGLLCVFVEVILNQWGALIWEYSWWGWPNVWLIIVAYCGGFALCAWFYDLDIPVRKKALLTVGVYALDVVLFLVFAVALHWI